jgi:pimeloyl-ACP methyl ester carboxylesterase
MRWKRRLLLAALPLLVVFGPVLFRQALPHDERRFTGEPLDDLSYVEVEFHNSRQGIDLAGLLFVPAGEGPFPAAVIIHGSGSSARRSGWYTTITHDLLAHGIAVLLPDKRGSERSGGDWRTSSFEDLATDTLAAVEHLQSRNDDRLSRIGVVGMSQGGWIAPVAASRSEAIEFVVSVSGATVTPPEQLYYEEIHNLEQFGFLPGISHALALASSSWIRRVAQGEFWVGIEDFDPLVYWRALAVDALLLFGADDTNVPVATSAQRIRELGNPRLRVLVFEGSGHPIEEPSERGTRIIRSDAVDAIADFVLNTR